MAKYDKYHPNYERFYPGIKNRPDILAVLKKSARKMKYIELELKTEHFIYDQENKTVTILPSRESSYGQLREEEHTQFAADETPTEAVVIRKEMIQRLQTVLQKLEPSEAELIHVLFFEGLSERQSSKRTGIPQMTIHDRKKKILNKLHKLIEN